MDSFTHKWGLEVGGVEVEQKKLYLSLNLRGVGGRINYTPILLTSMLKKKKKKQTWDHLLYFFQSHSSVKP